MLLGCHDGSGSVEGGYRSDFNFDCGGRRQRFLTGSSYNLYSSRLHELRQPFLIRTYIRRKFPGRARGGDQSLRQQFRFHIRLRERAHRFHVEVRDDFARRAGRREECVPRDRHESRQSGFGYRRHVRQRLVACRARNAERFQASGNNLRQHRGIEKAQVRMAADQVGDRRRSSFIRHMRHARAREQIELFRRDVLAAARAV